MHCTLTSFVSWKDSSVTFYLSLYQLVDFKLVKVEANQAPVIQPAHKARLYEDISFTSGLEGYL